VHYLEEWRALSAHIEGLGKAAELHARFSAINSADSYGRGKRLGEHSKRLLADLKRFRRQFSTALPPLASRRLDEFFEIDGPVIDLPYETESRAVIHGVVVLVALAAELMQLLSGEQQLIRSRTEVAFAHLQRLLVVDPDVRTKWKKAFKGTGETSCEALGAVHLLSHQVLAFKVNAEGARTDLVFREPPSLELLERSSAALVLTEWKVAKDEKVAKQRFSEARKQADLYRQGPLAAVELTSYRYAVVVSHKQVPIPDDEVDGGVTYRHINIAIEPDTPSVAAKKKR